MFYNRFFLFFPSQLSKFGFWVAAWGVVINFKLSKDFLEISYFPKILSLVPFDNTFGNS